MPAVAAMASVAGVSTTSTLSSLSGTPQNTRLVGLSDMRSLGASFGNQSSMLPPGSSKCESRDSAGRQNSTILGFQKPCYCPTDSKFW